MSGEEVESMTGSCPACANSKSNTYCGALPSRLLPHYQAEMYVCGNCRTVYTWPVIPREELSRFYSELFTSEVGQALGESGETRRQMAASIYQGVERLLTPGGDTLDIGSGFGDWLQLLHDKNMYDHYYGIEPSKEMVAATRARCPWAHIFDASAEDIGEVFDDEKFSLITLIAVIEHLRNPGLVIQNVSSSLAPAGITVIIYPRIDSIPARLLGKKWHLFSPVAHLTLFSRQGLTRCLLKSGLQVIHSRFFRQYYSMDYILSLAGLFFPIFDSLAGMLNRINFMKKVHFRMYTGIEVMVGRKVVE